MKVLTLGSYQTERSLMGDVAIQEKVDGSNFRFWFDTKKEIHYGSHHKEIHIGEDYGMFREAIEYLESKKDKWPYPENTYFFCEYLQKPKHNCLKYNCVPKNHLVLFDMFASNGWLEYGQLKSNAEMLGIDIIPQFKFGKTNVDELKSFFDYESYLGGQKIEGVIVKNYHEDIMVGGVLRPLFVKLVRPELRESMIGTRTSTRQTLDDYLKSFRLETRWEKAIQSLKEENKLTISPKDIGPLLVQIQKDIVDEEKENIGHHLYRHFINDILRRSTAGFADYYKDQLLKRIGEELSHSEEKEGANE